MASAPASPTGPSVRLEVRLGSARPAVYEVGDGGFLVGSVPGCDLRLPGTNLAPVLCLIARHSGGASLRKLAPVMPITVNGRAVTATYLDDGDKLAIGQVELVVCITRAAAPAADPSLANERKLLEQQRAELEAARLFLHRKQEQVEADARKRAQELETRAAQQPRAADKAFDQKKAELADREADLADREAGLAAQVGELTRQQAEVEALRQELESLRQDLAERIQTRRDRLLAQHQAVRKAARRVQRRKATLEERERQAHDLEQALALKAAEIESSHEQIGRERQLVEEQHLLLAARQREVGRDLEQRLADLEEREGVVAVEKAALEKGQKQHQADLVRLDRIQAAIEGRQKSLEQRALEIDRKFEQLQRDSRELEEQATQLDDWHNRLAGEAEQLQTRQAEMEAASGQFEQRAAMLEGQQAMLTTLRTRLERMREELRQQEQALSDQRVLQEASETDLQARLVEADRQRSDLVNDRQLFDDERRRFEDRRATLDQAVASIRQAQESMTADQEDIQRRQQEIEATTAEQTEQANVLLARGEQLEQMANKVQAERQAIRDREAGLAAAEQNLAKLQEHLRRRSADLDAREQQAVAAEAALADQQAALAVRLGESEQLQLQARAQLEELRQQLEVQTVALEQKRDELGRQQAEFLLAREQMFETDQLLTGGRQALESERSSFQVERQMLAEQDRQAREAFQRARDEAIALGRQLPELELRTSAALDRLAQAREQLREHLTEVHAFARQGREELEAARKFIHADGERLRQQELELEVARDEHRLAVAAFRQQLIEWQGRIGEMRQSMQVGSSQLDLRQAEIDERSRQVESTTARLAAEAEELERERREVSERHGEMTRHLGDMREWYRKKLRELAGVDLPPDAEPGEGDVVPMPPPGAAREAHDRDPARAVLTLTDEVEPADRQLGEQLAALELVDGDTLQALWAEARRQRRSLRQVLLAGGYLTLYQLALIETGNLDGLVLGPVRVIDKLAANTREAVYRVFDPRRGGEALLRHLADGEMHDAVHPDEFRQRFAAAAAVQHPNVAQVLEVLEIGGRPAALVEWVGGLPATDWPGLVAAPGVWYRLVSQAALAVQAVHDAGLSHGRIDAAAFVLTGQGRVKLVGLGVPRWLGGGDDGPAGDVAALGRLAAGWAAAGGGKGGKPKPLPAELVAVVERFTTDEADRQYPSIREAVEALEQAGGAVPGSATTWDRLVRLAREQGDATAARQSA